MMMKRTIARSILHHRHHVKITSSSSSVQSSNNFNGKEAWMNRNRQVKSQERYYHDKKEHVLLLSCCNKFNNVISPIRGNNNVAIDFDQRRYYSISGRKAHNKSCNEESPYHYEPYQLLEKSVSSISIASKVQRVSSRYDEIMSNMINQDSSSITVEDETKELSSLSKLAKLYTEFKEKVHDMNEMHEFMIQAKNEGDGDGDGDGNDAAENKEMVKECQYEIEEIQSRLDTIGANIVDAIIPRNDNDFNTDAILELRAGTGGDEASLFCGELLNCYQKVASNKGWAFDVLSITRSDLKGVKEVAVSIASSGGNYYSGDDADPPLGPYGYFKFESGVHRVQRVPVNDVRIHTSAASVGVLPAPSEKGRNDDLLPGSDLKIETMRSSGAGGQHVNTTESAVRITHIPTGITASIQDERSQHKNKAKAMKLITARVRDQLEAEEAKKRGSVKSSLMGGGDRSERIRTYNFPQDRITDHRCKHSEHGIEKLLAGGSGMDDTGLVGTFLPHMKKMERIESMEALEEEEVISRSKNGKYNH